MLTITEILSRFKKKKFLSRLLNGSMVGLDIGAGFIKAVEISFAQEAPLLKAAAIVSIPEEFTQEGRIVNFKALGEFLAKLWVKGKLTCRDVATAIDSRNAFVREITFPAMTGEELKTAVKWDMGNYIPYKENSYYYDFAPTTSFNANEKESRVLLAAALTETVDDIAGAILAAGCKIWSVDVEALAAQETLENDAGKVCVVVDIGHFHTQVIIFSERIPAVTRIIPWGGQRFTEIIRCEFEIELKEAEDFKLCPAKDQFRQKFTAEDFWQKQAKAEKEINSLIEELSGEIQHVMDYYLGKNPSKKTNNIYLTGGGANFKNLADGMANKFAPIPVKVHNPLDLLKIAPGIDKDYINSVAPQLTIAIGLALRGGTYG